MVDLLILDALERCGLCPTEIYNIVFDGGKQASIPPDIFERIRGAVPYLYLQSSLPPDVDLNQLVFIAPHTRGGESESEAVCSPVWQLHFESPVTQQLAVTLVSCETRNRSGGVASSKTQSIEPHR
ncbi:hypothetical protein V5O48_011032 [Marasmius crinis-equi]|uniref:Uncharacterized protein n=1 Tax=Marasmius crinis-equi TaxID=585013 RepID=A0ABR3F6R5_9AGAR